MENNIEKGPEGFLTKEEVLKVLSRWVSLEADAETEPAKIRRELSDEQGLYLLELEEEGEQPGETVEHMYMRKGEHGKNATGKTIISVTSYKDGMPTGGYTLATFDEASRIWTKTY